MTEFLSASRASGLIEADAAAMMACLERIRTEDAAAVPVLGAAGRRRLREATADLAFRPARPVVGEGEKAVTQDFEICDDVPRDGPYGRCAAALSGLVNAALENMARPPFSAIDFNDLVVQRYQPVPCGISPHRDHIRYVNLIGILVIDGAGDFFVCDDRQGRNARCIDAQEGDLLLMRGPGFDDSRHRPFHMLGEVTRERLILGVRQDARVAAVSA